MFNDVLGKIKRLMYIANELDSGEIKVSAIADYLGVCNKPFSKRNIFLC
jgi:hypothetical protein